MVRVDLSEKESLGRSFRLTYRINSKGTRVEHEKKQELWRKGKRIPRLVENDQTGNYETNTVGGQGGHCKQGAFG